MAKEGSAEATIRDIKRKTQRKYNMEGKIRIVIEGLRGEQRIVELCRRAGIAESLYYGWGKEFMEADLHPAWEPAAHSDLPAVLLQPVGNSLVERLHGFVQ
jgi:transposase-like protein